MTTYSKSSPVGIDKVVHRIITSMNNQLPTLWGISSSLCKFYGRADVNEEKVTWSSGKDSIPLGFDDTLSLAFTSYFIVEPDILQEGLRSVATLELHCHGNIDKVYPLITTHTADEELIRSVKSVVGNHLDDIGTIERLEVAYPKVSFKYNFEKKYHA